MSGRHKMPPAGRRKAAAENVEDTIATEAAEAAEGVEAADTEAVVEESVGTDEPGIDEPSAEDADEADDTDEADEPSAEDADETAQAKPLRARPRVSLPVVLAVIALVLALASGVLRWLTISQDENGTARAESVQAAKEITTEMLSYETETVEQQLTAVRERMTGDFLGTYTAMIDEVIPAAHAQQIAAVADVVRAGVVSAKPDSAEMVLYVNQSVQVGNHMPQKTPSIARVTMVKVGDRWLMSEYEPVPM